jgi:NAD(P)-dependent dehydrogenase (short-subunit alcohol dehydrogenase family)
MALLDFRHRQVLVVGGSTRTRSTATVFPYSCAKAATNCLVQCAAIEFGPRNIRVNAILPGPIESAASRGQFNHT